MISQSVVHTRNEINQETLIALEQLIQKVIAAYKEKHNGLLDGFKYGNTFDILDTLENQIRNTIQSKDYNTPFIKYVGMLGIIYSVFGALDAEMELHLIAELQNILIDQLKSLKDADWEEKKREERYRSEDLDGRIGYCLNRLNDAMYYASKSEQSFCDKWKVQGSMNDYYVWLHLLGNFKSQINSGYLTRLVSELRHRFGLSETQTGACVDANNPIYGLNVDKQNHYHHIYILPVSVAVPQQKKRELGVLYLKKNNDNKIEVYNYDDNYPKILNEKEYNALRTCGIDFNVTHVQKITNDEKIRDILSICRLRVGYFEKIVKDAEYEIMELQKKHSCLGFEKQQKHVVDTINLGKGDELKKAIYLIKNKDKFNKKINTQIKLLGDLDELDEKLDESKLRVFSAIKSALTYQLKLYELKELIEKVKRPTSSSNSEKMELIREITGDDSVFSAELLSQVNALAEQLSIWSLENLMLLSSEYLKDYAARSYNDISECAHIPNPAKYLSEQFVSYVIDKLINPLRYILSQRRIELSVSDLTSDLEHVYAEYLKEIEATSASTSTSEPVSLSESDSAENLNSSIHLIKHNNVDYRVHEQQLQAQEAITYFGILKTEQKRDLIYKLIATNDALRMALSAGSLYLKAVKGSTHGEHGEEAAILFIKNILELKDKSRENIQKEALAFVNGQAKTNAYGACYDYGTWYGGASGFHKHSRIAFVIDSGLLDNLKGVIFPYKTAAKNRFFDHQNTFANLKNEERKELTKRIGMM